MGRLYPSVSQLDVPKLAVALTLVNDALEADHGEQTAAHSGTCDQAQNDDAKQASSVPARGLLEELPFLCVGHVWKKESERESKVLLSGGRVTAVVAITRTCPLHIRVVLAP